jgi:hypothetical protein
VKNVEPVKKEDEKEMMAKKDAPVNQSLNGAGKK